MKRDLDLIREILLKIEESTPTERISVASFTTDKNTFDIVSLHIELLIDCGYIEASPIRFMGQTHSDFVIKRITSAGYDYIDSVRSNTVWNKTKETLETIGGSAALDVVKEIGKKVTLGMIGF